LFVFIWKHDNDSLAYASDDKRRGLLDEQELLLGSADNLGDLWIFASLLLGTNNLAKFFVKICKN
jgi:hypothetical protein